MDAQRQLAAQQWIDLCCQIVYRSPVLTGEEKLAWKFLFRRSKGRAAQVIVQETEIAADQGARKATAGGICLSGLLQKQWAELVEPVRNGHWHVALVDPRIAAGPDHSRPLLPEPDDDWDFGGMPASCELVDDRVLQYVRRWPREGQSNKQGLRGTTKIAFESLWLRAGRRATRILYSAHDLGAAQGRRDAASSGRKLLRNLEEYGLAKVVDPDYWLIDVFSPVDVQTARLATGSADESSHSALQQASFLPDVETRAAASAASPVDLGDPRAGCLGAEATPVQILPALRVFTGDDSPQLAPAEPVATPPPVAEVAVPDVPPNLSRPSVSLKSSKALAHRLSSSNSATESAQVREDVQGGRSGARCSANPDVPRTGQAMGGEGYRDAVDRAATDSESQLGPIAFRHLVAAVLKGRLEPVDKVRQKLELSREIERIVACPFLYEWVAPLIAENIVEAPDKKLAAKITKLLGKIDRLRRDKLLKRPASCLFVVTAIDVFRQEGLDWRPPTDVLAKRKPR